MSNPKFTKGPWYVSNVTVNGAHVPCSYGVACGGFTIASDVTSGATFGIVNEIQRANAAVMAAAPEMYYLLAELLEKEYVDTPTALKINAMLAKARGDAS